MATAEIVAVIVAAVIAAAVIADVMIAAADDRDRSAMDSYNPAAMVAVTTIADVDGQSRWVVALDNHHHRNHRMQCH